jgi:hypothetical protein
MPPLHFSDRKRSFRRNRLNQFLTFLVILILALFNPLGALPVQAVDAPLLSAPADGITVRSTSFGGALAVPPLAIPTFEWQAVAGATSYVLEISQDINFITKQTFTTPLTSYTPTSAGSFSDGLWYWRVKVNLVGAPYSLVWSFWREWASADNYPVLTSPSDGATVTFFDPPTFSWEPVVGAAKYRLEIASNFDFTTIVKTYEVLPTTHQPLTKLTNGGYFWRVIPLDPTNRLGAASEVRSFTMGYTQAPIQIEPADGSFPTFTPTFRWQAVRGAQHYVLEYSTSSTFGPGTISITTNNITYTPQATLSNDINYYWRVRAASGLSLSDWSATWVFQKRWYLTPTLLTPTNNYSYVRFPFFSWTPVPGAARYRIQIDKDPDFVGLILDQYTSNTYYTPTTWDGAGGSRYWRVIPYDGSGKPGKESAEYSFQNGAFTTPFQMYPLYYYSPDALLNPREDRTVPYPLFMWSRMTTLGTGANTAVSYQVQVCSDSLCNTVVWSEVTQNLYAAPTTTNPFTPTPGVNYWWRVRGLDAASNLAGSGWSQIWKVRFNPALAPASATGAPQLWNPVQAAEIVDQTPLFQWRPVTGADFYEIEIYDNAEMTGTVVVSDTVSNPFFSPIPSLAQRSLIPLFPEKLAFGSYYWRVKAHTAGGYSAWSSTQRFQIAAQSERLPTRSLGLTAQPYQIASDPLDAGGTAVELTGLYVTQDTDYWYFGFNVITNPVTNTVYALALDLNHSDGAGATALPAPFGSVTTISAHRPEYVVLIAQQAGEFLPEGVSIYTWMNGEWSDPAALSQGGIAYDDGSQYVELALHNTAIGYATTGGSYAVSLLSLPEGGGDPFDSVPSDPLVPGGGPVSRFASVSQRMNPRLPPSNLGGDTSIFAFAPLFYWEYPSGSNGTDPWAGVRMEYHFDPGFTNKIGQFELSSTAAYYCPTSYTWLTDLSGNNTYYWRIQPRYNNNAYGVWSQGWRFEMRNLKPLNLSESVTFATPTFTWDRVEGAERYDLQVSRNIGYTDLVTNINTTQNTFTPQGTYDNNRTYYWRVRAVRNGVTAQDYWSETRSFFLLLPIPTGLTPNDPDPMHAVRRAPTFCWSTLLAESGGAPVLAAYLYQLQVSLGDPTFTTKTTYTTEQSCFTPPEGYADGAYYWRVAMQDGQARLGGFSPTAVVTKQYPVTTLLSPVGGTINQTPVFRWTPVSGAASYKFEISTNVNFSPLYDSATTNQTSFTPTKLYTLNQTYYWRVAIVDVHGKVGPFTGATMLLDYYRVFMPVALE